MQRFYVVLCARMRVYVRVGGWVGGWLCPSLPSLLSPPLSTSLHLSLSLAGARTRVWLMNGKEHGAPGVCQPAQILDNVLKDT